MLRESLALNGMEILVSIRIRAGRVESLPGSECMESKEYVNPFIAVHRKAEALKKRGREEHDKDSELRETRLQEAARDLDVSAK
jgi:hypothetical protein